MQFLILVYQIRVQQFQQKNGKIEGERKKRGRKNRGNPVKKNLFDSRASWKDCRAARLHRRITHRLNLSARN